MYDCTSYDICTKCFIYLCSDDIYVDTCLKYYYHFALCIYLWLMFDSHTKSHCSEFVYPFISNLILQNKLQSLE